MRWYQTAWGIALLGLGSLVFLGVLVFGTITIKYLWQIKHGQGSLLQQQIYGGFSKNKDTSSPLSTGPGSSSLLAENVPYLGSPTAPTTIVVFGDFRCPNTKNAMPILKQLAGKYGYKVKIIFRDFPGESIHPGATRLAQIGTCAYEQGKYWNVSDYLFSKQDSLPVYLSPTDISDLAGATDLDLEKLKQCMDSSLTSQKVNRDYADGFKFDVGGTPTFFINGQKVEGVVPFDAWEKVIKQL
jgi:protein-disulfide isomerase